MLHFLVVKFGDFSAGAGEGPVRTRAGGAENKARKIGMEGSQLL